MAVVISGVNNNDKITATDGTIDLLSGVNFSGEVEVPSFKVGSNIQLGNAGIVTATTFIGNLTGNVNSSSNLLLQIGGSEKFRVSSSGQLGIGGANYGTSGQVLTSGGSGSAATWSTLSTDLVSDTSPQLGADLDTNGFDINFDANKYLTFASTSSAGQIYHTGSHFYVWNGTGNTQIHADQIYLKSNTGSENMLRGVLNGTVELYYNASKKIETTNTGVTVTGLVTNDGIRTGDLEYIMAGNSGDIAIFHDSNGSIHGTSASSYIKCQGVHDNILDIFTANATGKIRLKSNNLAETMLAANGNGSVDLYNNNELKLSTNYEGIDVKDTTSTQSMVKMHTSSGFAGSLYGVGNSVIALLAANLQWGVKVNSGGATELYHTGNAKKLETTSTGVTIQGNINLSGIVTATTVTQRTSKFYGLTTTERNALSPSEGDIVYNTTANKHEFYTSSNSWAPISATAPTFDNASGSLATFYSESRSYITPTSPTASGDEPISYSISAGSLPSGMSINSSTGVLSGTPNAVGSDTTSNFTVQASNGGGAVERDYSITVKAPVTTNYSYTGSTVTWSKPSSDVKRVLFRMWGGAGTHGTCTSNNHYPGRGGKTEGVINVESHNTLYLQVGEAGKDTSTGSGGWPNGGSGNIQHSCKGAGGGGSSNIYHSSGTGSYTYIVAVAGGGGSVSHGNPNSNGGDGGGTNGQSSNRGGAGGQQNAGGGQGSTPCGNTGGSGTGTRLQGGSAGGGSGCTNAGAGGGGGWWGGGAGGNSNSGNTYGGGGGGSGYFDTSLVSGGSTKQASESGWDTNRPSGIAGRASYGNNNRGGHGYITLIY